MEGSVNRWSWVVRITHWLVAVLFLANFTFVEDGTMAHEWVGYALVGLVLCRLLWGLVAPKHERLSSMKPSLSGAIGHIKDLLKTRRDDHQGHNPAAVFMVWGLWCGIVLTGLSGWATTLSSAGWIEEGHEVIANGTALLALVHIAAVIVMSKWTGNPYLSSMLAGKKLKN